MRKDWFSSFSFCFTKTWPDNAEFYCLIQAEWNIKTCNQNYKKYCAK